MHIKDILQITEDKSRYQLFVDLDGVVADFEAGVEKALKAVFGEEEQHSEERYENDPKYRKMMWKATSEYQKMGNKLWQELPLMHDAMKLWNYVKGYDPEILTATGKPEYGADEQKRQWVAKHFGSHIPVNLVRKAVEKQQYADNNHILIDDKEKAINPWVQAGGIGILHTSAENTIRQLKQLGL